MAWGKDALFSGSRSVKGLPRDLGLDYSIENYGFVVAWRIFWSKLADFGANSSMLSEIDYYRLMAMFKNGDRRGYLTILVDSKLITHAQAMEFIGRKVVARRQIIFHEPLKQSVISKWMPGEHYYALDKKFGTYAEAEAYLAEQGFKSLGLRERHAYRGGE